MSKYYIFAAEDMYHGLHGMYEIDVVEVADESELDDIAVAMSYEVMESYAEIMDQLEEAAAESCDCDGDSEEFDQAYEDAFEDVCADNLYYYWYKIKPEFSGISCQDLQVLAYDYENFEKVYCVLKQAYYGLLVHRKECRIVDPKSGVQLSGEPPIIGKQDNGQSCDLIRRRYGFNSRFPNHNESLECSFRRKILTWKHIRQFISKPFLSLKWAAALNMVEGSGQLKNPTNRALNVTGSIEHSCNNN